MNRIFLDIIINNAHGGESRGNGGRLKESLIVVTLLSFDYSLTSGTSVRSEMEVSKMLCGGKKSAFC